MNDFYIRNDDGLMEHYRLCKVCDKKYENMIQVAETEFFLRYIKAVSEIMMDKNFPVISKPNTTWFYINGSVSLHWSGAYFAAIPHNYVFQYQGL